MKKARDMCGNIFKKDSCNIFEQSFNLMKHSVTDLSIILKKFLHNHSQT